VRDDQVVLQCLRQRVFGPMRMAARQFVAQAMRAEQLVGVAAEAGGDAVDRLAAAHLVGDEIRRATHAGELRRIKRHRRAARHRHQLRAGQVMAVQKNGLAHERLRRVRGCHCRVDARCMRGATPAQPIAAACSSSTRSVLTSSARGTSN
jgi:hypothetical protein